jgi:1-acyl-sn-glycerol-3-phosphate acyltransferase
VGDEFFITGRIKDIVFKGGRNIYPQEVEEIASQVEGVRKGCVVAFGAADAASGTERLVIVAETKERGTAARQKIAAAVVERVAMGIGVPPDTVEMLVPHSIPKTSSGKLRRDRTRQLYLAGKLDDSTRPLWLQVSRLAVAGGAKTAWPLLRRTFEKLYGVYAALVFIPWLPLAWLALLLAPGRRAAARVTSFSVRVYLFLIGCRVRVEGRDLMSAPGPKVLVSNHTSYFDVLVLMGALGVEYHFVAKKEVHSMPFIGTFLRKLGHFSFDRSDPQARARQAAEMQEALRRGESVFVFPEGTFTRQPGVRPFQLGAFKAAVAAGCPVLPVALRGTRRFLREGSILPRPTSVRITIGPALEARPGAVDEWREIVRLRDVTREIIARESGEPLL